MSNRCTGNIISDRHPTFAFVLQEPSAFALYLVEYLDSNGSFFGPRSSIIFFHFLGNQKPISDVANMIEVGLSSTVSSENNVDSGVESRHYHLLVRPEILKGHSLHVAFTFKLNL